MKKLLLIFILALVINHVSAQVPKIVNVTTAGTLSTLLTATEKATITNLTIIGEINARDFNFMQNNLTALSTLDISNVIITEYIGTDGPPTSFPTQPTYPINEIPNGSFVNNSSLSKISLPASITSIGFFAFKNVDKLDSVIIPQGVNLIYSDAFYNCDNLKTVRFLSTTCPSFGKYSSYAFCKSGSTTSYTAPDFIVPNGCTSTYRNSTYWLLSNYSTKINESTTTNITQFKNKNISVYPNPVKNEFTIDFDGNSTFEILNLYGQVIYKGNIINSTTVQTSNFAKGEYIIRLATANSFDYKKIIKE